MSIIEAATKATRKRVTYGIEIKAGSFTLTEWGLNESQAKQVHELLLKRGDEPFTLEGLTFSRRGPSKLTAMKAVPPPAFIASPAQKPMTTTKLVICLANSRKLSGRCVAGIELSDDMKPLGWIRPISAREHAEVSEYERQYQDGSDPQVLDLLTIPLVEPRPTGYQQENWLLDAESQWVRQRRMPPATLAPYTTLMPTLWKNGHHTWNGQNDRIPLDQLNGINSSLCLIRVSTLTLHVSAPGQAFGNDKRRVQGRFQFNGELYSLWVTDPHIENQYLAMADGEYRLGSCYLTVSLGEASNGFVYKLIAAVIPTQ